VVTLALARWLAGALRGAGVVERNYLAERRRRGLMVLSGVLEPLLYLLSIGYGVGALIGRIPLPHGGTATYAEFVAPAMLAVSAMQGAVAETVFNFFVKMKYARLYDGILATPVRPWEVAFGELVWAMLRGLFYSAIFLTFMVGMGVTSWWRALLAWPASLLVGLVFGGIGMAASTVMRSWQDFDLVITVQMALFMFSATFVPLTRFPASVRWLAELSPLTHGVVLLRGITLGGETPLAMVTAAGFMLLVTVVSFLVAARRMTSLLAS